MDIVVEKACLLAAVRELAGQRGLTVDDQTAAAVLDTIGSAYPCRRETAMIVADTRGRTALLTSEEVRAALRPCLRPVLSAVRRSAPVAVRLTGYPLRGLSLLIQEECGIVPLE